MPVLARPTEREPETATLQLDGGFPYLPPGSLRGFERIAVPICNAVNTTRWIKAFVQLFVCNWAAFWMSQLAQRRWRLNGMEHVEGLEPPKGVVLVSNHRSFFDMYVTSSLLYKRSTFMDNLYFPVRSRFFYSNPLGLLVNLSISGCAMWPPVFRDDRKTALNPTALHQAAWALNRPGAVLGYHPEGTRGKGPDPYEFLPAKKGVGKLLRCCHPDTIVLPYFILGMGSDFKAEVGYAIRGAKSDQEGAIRIWFGESIRVGDLVSARGDQELAEHLMEVVGELSEKDKQKFGAWVPPEFRKPAATDGAQQEP